MSQIPNLYTENSFDEGFCGCNSYTGEKCAGHTQKYADESYTGKFPMAFGSRGDHVITLQRFLVSRLVLTMGTTPYGYFGKATQKALTDLEQPIVIYNEKELNEILGIMPAIPAVSQRPTVNSGLSTNWKDTAKDPNQVMGILGRLGSLVKKKPATAKGPEVAPGITQSATPGVTPGTQSTTDTPPTTPAAIPPAVWVVGGLVLLIVVVFVVMKALKD